MADIYNTKAKLLRGVVQDNVDIVQGVRTKNRAKHRLSFRYWLSACIAMLGVAYLAIPSQVVSTANTSPNEAAGDRFRRQYRANPGVRRGAESHPDR